MDILNKAGLKVTKPRNIILNIFKNTNKILEVSEIYEMCKTKGLNVNLSTIYRICEIFSEKRILDKVVSKDRISKYKLSVDTHVHELTCNVCNKKIEINCPFNILSEYIENQTGFTLTKHDIDISGICNECKKTRTDS